MGELADLKLRPSARGTMRDSHLELANADDGQQASALGAFLAVAEEEVAAAGGAEVADKDI